jgi:hypothetical protein
MASKLVGYRDSSTKLLTNDVSGYVTGLPLGRYAMHTNRPADMRLTPTLRTALHLVAVMALLSCNAADPTAPLPQLQRLSAAESVWNGARLSNYSFTSTVVCYCVDGFTSPMRVTVRRDTVTTVVDIQTGASNPPGWRSAVPALFALIRREAVERPDRLVVTYDARLGYPRRIAFGEPERDAGGTIAIDNLRSDP